jgi:hypothetical protein
MLIQPSKNSVITDENLERNGTPQTAHLAGFSARKLHNLCADV